MRIQFITGLAIDTIKANIKTLLPLFMNDDYKELIKKLSEILDNEIFIKDTNYELKENLKLDSSLIGANEINNVIAIYEGLPQDLPMTIATDERFWAGLSIIHFWSYVQMRWKIKENLDESKVLSHYLYYQDRRKSLTRDNAIARLWWIGRLTYDSKRNDKYELTKYVLADLDYINDFFGRNFSNNPRIVKEVIEAIEQIRNEGLKINRIIIRQLCVYVNMLGGVYILDEMSEGTIKKKVIDKAYKILKTS